MATIAAQVHEQQDRIDQLQAQTNTLAEAVNAAEARLEESEARLASIRDELRRAGERFAAVRNRFEERAVQMFITGSGTGLEFILGATSVSDFMDRIEFSAAITQDDAELANEMANLKAQLGFQQANEARIAEERRAAYGQLRERMSMLRDRFAEARASYARIIQLRGEAQRLVDNLAARYRDELAAMIPPPQTGGSGSAVGGANPFQVCPVGTPHALTDSFGAPRYGGGYHLHAGNDIMAPEGVPIYATFAGTAYDASNGLGGLAVRVEGASGWTYNAHMVRIGQLGPVQPGDVIGYVGATGDTSTPHNHFEWHPHAIPADWPNSPYGYSVVGDALNPYPLLVAVC
ncbi:MAG: peptidoglycan DD-metalloendopeptidase family protein [Actinomycetota bacterium]